MLSSVESYMRASRAAHGKPLAKADAIMCRWREWLWGFRPYTCNPSCFLPTSCRAIRFPDNKDYCTSCSAWVHAGWLRDHGGLCGACVERKAGV